MYTKAIAGKVITGLGIAGMLLASAPIAMAHDKDDESKGRGATVSTEAKAKHDDKGLHLGSFIGLQFGKHKDGDDDQVGSTTRQERRDDRQADRAEVRSHVVGGTVTSVNGNTFVLSGKSTTTVTIDGNTKVVSRDGATTTAAITAGAHVIAFGSTTATSTSGTSFTASVVIVFNQAIGHLKHWLRLDN